MDLRNNKLIDSLIMGNVSRKNGPAVVDTNAIISGHALDQAARKNQVESSRRSLGLAGDRLKENQRQFNTSMNFKRDQMDWAKDQGSLANIISALGLGVSAADSFAERNRALERNNFRTQMIDKYGQREDSMSKFFADMLKYMG